MTHEGNLEEVAKQGNEIARDVCEQLLLKLGPTKEYVTAVTALASTLFFHLYRLGKHDGKVVELLQAALDDVSHNVQKLDGERIRILVERK